MSLTEVRPYFRARLEAVGLTEWDDAFNVDNIPDTLIDGSFHISASPIRNVTLSQNDLQLEHEVSIKTFIKGYAQPKDALDKAMERLDAILKEVLKPSNRVTGTGGLRNVLFLSSEILPMAESQDNVVLVNVVFRVQINLDVR